MDHPDQPDTTPPAQSTQRELEFEDPIYLTDDELEEIERELARKKRRLTSSDRRAAKKAAKMARYPVERCVIAEDWADRRFGPVALYRSRPDDEKVAFGSGIVDLGALGLKSGIFEAGMPRRRADEMIDRVESLGADLVDCEPEVAATVLRHAVAFSAKCGFDPPPEYYALREFFGEADPGEVEVPLGHRGKPVLVPGPKDDVEELAETLEEKFGRNGFYLGAPTKDSADEASREARARAPTPDQGEKPVGDDEDDSDTDIIMPGDL